MSFCWVFNFKHLWVFFCSYLLRVYNLVFGFCICLVSTLVCDVRILPLTLWYSIHWCELYGIRWLLCSVWWKVWSGRWSKTDMEMSSTWRELKAVFFMILKNPEVSSFPFSWVVYRYPEYSSVVHKGMLFWPRLLVFTSQYTTWSWVDSSCIRLVPGLWFLLWCDLCCYLCHVLS